MQALAAFARDRSAVVGGEIWIKRADGAWYTLRVLRVRGWLPSPVHLLVWPNRTKSGWTRFSGFKWAKPRHEFKDAPTREQAMLASLRWAEH